MLSVRLLNILIRIHNFYFSECDTLEFSPSPTERASDCVPPRGQPLGPALSEALPGGHGRGAVGSGLGRLVEDQVTVQRCGRS